MAFSSTSRVRNTSVLMKCTEAKFRRFWLFLRTLRFLRPEVGVNSNFKTLFHCFSLYFIFQLYSNKFVKCADKTFLKKTLQFFVIYQKVQYH
jgi:hypothetical protein